MSAQGEEGGVATPPQLLHRRHENAGNADGDEWPESWEDASDGGTESSADPKSG